MIDPAPMPHAVVIVTTEHFPSVKKRLAESDTTVVSEADFLQVQDTLLARAPELVLMHSAFATTSRGASFISALKGKPADSGTAIRVFIEDEKAPLLITETSLSIEDALLETSRPLERAGTRQAARHPMNRYPVAINGDAGQLIDLSVSGAQVQSAARLRPMKVARLVLPDKTGDIRLQGTTVWAIAVMAAGAMQYRAGIEFVNPDKRMLAAFCARYGGAPDPTLHKA